MGRVARMGIAGAGKARGGRRCGAIAADEQHSLRPQRPDAGGTAPLHPPTRRLKPPAPPRSPRQSLGSLSAPACCGGAGRAAVLPLLADGSTSPSSRRLARCPVSPSCRRFVSRFRWRHEAGHTPVLLAGKMVQTRHLPAAPATRPARLLRQAASSPGLEAEAAKSGCRRWRWVGFGCCSPRQRRIPPGSAVSGPEGRGAAIGMAVVSALRQRRRVAPVPPEGGGFTRWRGSAQGERRSQCP